MAAKILQIRDDVVAALNVPSRFAMPVEAAAKYATGYTVAELATLRATVVPVSYAGEPLDRERESVEHKIQVGFQVRPASVEPADVDPYVTLVEQVRDWFLSDAGRELATSEAVCVGADVLAVYVPDDIDAHMAFTSVIELAFAEWRERA